MVNFDFDTLVDRSDSGNMKLISTPECVREVGGITYSGAEMDFKTAPVIIDALTKKAQSGIYGYTLCDENYLDAVTHWMQTQRDWHVKPEWIVPTYGIMQGFCIAMRTFTQPGDGIILQTPLYMRYRSAVDQNERAAVSNPLLYQDGSYRINFDQLEQCMAEPKNKLLVLCNPHNPTGKVWPKADLAHMAALAKQYNVLIYSDEIFGEVVFPGHTMYPFSTIPGAEEISLIGTSLGKAFNFTGFSHGNIIIPNAELRGKFQEQRDRDHYGSIDPFAYAAVSAAYRTGAAWLEAMVAYVYQNAKVIDAFFQHNLPQVSVIKPEGSYILWIDWRSLGMNEDELIRFLIDEAYLELDPGSHYGVEGTGFTRMNIASPRAEIEKSLGRLKIAAEKRGFVT